MRRHGLLSVRPYRPRVFGLATFGPVLDKDFDHPGPLRVVRPRPLPTKQQVFGGGGIPSNSPSGKSGTAGSQLSAIGLAPRCQAPPSSADSDEAVVSGPNGPSPDGSHRNGFHPHHRKSGRFPLPNDRRDPEDTRPQMLLHEREETRSSFDICSRCAETKASAACVNVSRKTATPERGGNGAGEGPKMRVTCHMLPLKIADQRSGLRGGSSSRRKTRSSFGWGYWLG